ncbi:MAG: hypothetical protein HOM14_03850 [Gammaproteobacteria bacterium]|nr:hypothetical protein [Gammaproteobacteria bacterium]
MVNSENRTFEFMIVETGCWSLIVDRSTTANGLTNRSFQHWGMALRA